jgi:hypothetical protein
MKIKVSKQYNYSAGEYLNDGEAEMEISKSQNGDIILEVDGNMYFIPMDVFTGILSPGLASNY